MDPGGPLWGGEPPTLLARVSVRLPPNLNQKPRVCSSSFSPPSHQPHLTQLIISPLTELAAEVACCPPQGAEYDPHDDHPGPSLEIVFANIDLWKVQKKVLLLIHSHFFLPHNVFNLRRQESSRWSSREKSYKSLLQIRHQQPRAHLNSICQHWLHLPDLNPQKNHAQNNTSEFICAPNTSEFSCAPTSSEFSCAPNSSEFSCRSECRWEKIDGTPWEAVT